MLKCGYVFIWFCFMNRRTPWGKLCHIVTIRFKFLASPLRTTRERLIIPKCSFCSAQVRCHWRTLAWAFYSKMLCSHSYRIRKRADLRVSAKWPIWMVQNMNLPSFFGKKRQVAKSLWLINLHQDTCHFTNSHYPFWQHPKYQMKCCEDNCYLLPYPNSPEIIPYNALVVGSTELATM